MKHFHSTISGTQNLYLVQDSDGAYLGTNNYEPINAG